MAFQPGHKLSKGRPVGTITQNRKTTLQIVEAALGKPLMQEWIELYQEIRKTNKQVACRAIEGIAKYCMPTMQSIQVSKEVEGDIIEVQSRKIDETVNKISDIISDREPRPGDSATSSKQET